MKSFVVLVAALACASANPGLISGYSYATAPLGYGYSTLGYGYPALGHPGALTYAAPTVVAPAYTKTQYHAQDEFGQFAHGYSQPGQARAETRDAAGNVRGSYAYVDPNGKEVRVNYVADSNGFRAESNDLPVAPTATLVGPAPVQDTPEVASAKVAHFAAVQEATARSGRKRRGLAYTYPAATYSTLAHPTVNYGYTTYTPSALNYAYRAYSPVATTYAGYPYGTTYSALGAATLTQVHNNPGHAVSYRLA